jgi:hypothetical protein
VDPFTTDRGSTNDLDAQNEDLLMDEEFPEPADEVDLMITDDEHSSSDDIKGNVPQQSADSDSQGGVGGATAAIRQQQKSTILSTLNSVSNSRASSRSGRPLSNGSNNTITTSRPSSHTGSQAPKTNIPLFRAGKTAQDTQVEMREAPPTIKEASREEAAPSRSTRSADKQSSSKRISASDASRTVQFSAAQVDSFLLIHRHQIRDVTDCCKEEAKMLGAISMSSSIPDSLGAGFGDDFDESGDGIASTEKAFQEYLLNLESVLARKASIVHVLQQKIKGLLEESGRDKHKRTM